MQTRGPARYLLLNLLLTLPAFVSVPAASLAPSATIQALYAVKPEEGIFADARISPSGRHLVYVSETLQSGPDRRTVTVVDVKTRAVRFSTRGFNPHWSPDGKRIIFRTLAPGPSFVLAHVETGALVRDVIPSDAWDDFGWALRDGKDMILTDKSRIYYLEKDKAVPPGGRANECHRSGFGERPQVSRDGRRFVAFVRDEVFVRNVTDCLGRVPTGIAGGRGDFSSNGRFVAFHVMRSGGSDVQVLDTEQQTVRTAIDLPGLNLLPTWTADDRVCFYHDGPDYRGFMIAADVLRAPEHKLDAQLPGLSVPVRYQDVFPRAALPRERVALVVLWSPWSSASPQVLRDAARLAETLRKSASSAAVLAVPVPGTDRNEAELILRRTGTALSALSLEGSRLQATGALNETPATLIFDAGLLVHRQLGSWSFDSLLQRLSQILSSPR